MKVVKHNADILVWVVAALLAHRYRRVCELTCGLGEGGNDHIYQNAIVIDKDENINILLVVKVNVSIVNYGSTFTLQTKTPDSKTKMKHEFANSEKLTYV